MPRQGRKRKSESGSLCPFGKLLEQICDMKGVTQTELSRACGLSSTVISSMKIGDRLSRENVLTVIEGLVILGAITTERQVNTILQAARYPELRERSHADARVIKALRHQQMSKNVTTANQIDLANYLKPLCGRDELLSTICQQVTSNKKRLFTFTGPPGVGKTQLALAVANRVETQFSKGVKYVSLVTIPDANAVEDVIAWELGLREASVEKAEIRLITYIAQQNMLLILDNFEHVLEAKTLLTKLTEKCPNLTILVTSRQALALGQREQVIEIPPLHLPRLDFLPQASNLLHFSAIQLFIQRIEERGKPYLITEENKAAIATLCVYLDGLPLALEIAASWVRTLFTPEMLLKDFEEKGITRLEHPPVTSSSIPKRHISLQNLFAWSYQRLQPDEQKLFRRLSVFPGGGCSYDVAEEVCSIQEDLANCKLHIATLREHHLIETRPEEGRFSMLYTIRAYARDLLVESNEEKTVQTQHRDFFLRLTEVAELQLRGPEQRRWFQKLDRELWNLQAALYWSLIDAEKNTALLRLVGGLWQYWHIRGDTNMSIKWLAFAQATSNTENHLLWETKELYTARAKVFIAWATSLLDVKGISIRGQILGEDKIKESVLTCLEFGIKFYHKVDNFEGIAIAQAVFAMATYNSENPEETYNLLEESRAYLHEIGNAWEEARIYDFLGVTACKQASYDKARNYFTKGFEYFERAGDVLQAAVNVQCLGDIASIEGNYQQAEIEYRRALVLHRRCENRHMNAWALRNLGWIAFERGKLEQATEYFGAGLEAFWHLGSKEGIVSCLLGQAQALKKTVPHYEEAISLVDEIFTVARGNSYIYDDDIISSEETRSIYGAGILMSPQEARSYTKITLILPPTQK